MSKNVNKKGRKRERERCGDREDTTYMISAVITRRITLEHLRPMLVIHANQNHGCKESMSQRDD